MAGCRIAQLPTLAEKAVVGEDDIALLLACL